MRLHNTDHLFSLPRQKGPRTISSHPSWKRPDDHPSDEGQERNDYDFSSEAGAAILGLHYTTRTPSPDPSDDGAKQRTRLSLMPDDSLME